MDHREANRIQAVERYLLDELTPVQQDDFEAHLFDCPECAEELRAASIFLDNARSVLRAGSEGLSAAAPAVAATYGRASGGVSRRGWGWLERLSSRFTAPVWVPATAALCLLVVVGYQNLYQIPALRSQVKTALGAQVVPAFALLPVTRGDDQIIAAPASARSVLLWFDLTSTSPGGYLCEFQDESGKKWLTLPAQTIPGQDTLSVQIDRSGIPAGRNLLTVRASDGRELMKFRFVYQP
jgi:hypothetical protein